MVTTLFPNFNLYFWDCILYLTSFVRATQKFGKMSDGYNHVRINQNLEEASNNIDYKNAFSSISRTENNLLNIEVLPF